MGSMPGREPTPEESRSPVPPRSLGDPEATYRTLVEGVPSAILYIDAVDDPSTNLYTSPQVEDVLGIAPAEWQSDPDLWFRMIHAEDRDRVVREHRASNVSGDPFTSEYRVLTPDGREVWIRDEAVLVRDEHGRALFWRGVMLDVTHQKRTEEKLRQSLDILRRTMQERRELLGRLGVAQEQERRRIAADIHDDSIQVMSSVDVRLQMLLADLETPNQRSTIEGVHDTVQLAIERLRHLLFELRPPSLEEEGLAAALRIYLEQAARDSGFWISVEDELGTEPPDEVRVTIYRIMQEAITNARKHAQAGHAGLSLRTTDGGVSASLTDDGRGFDTEGTKPEPGHLGLATMTERAEVAGGWCRVESRPGRGTTVECWIPLEI